MQCRHLCSHYRKLDVSLIDQIPAQPQYRKNIQIFQAPKDEHGRGGDRHLRRYRDSCNINDVLLIRWELLKIITCNESISHVCFVSWNALIL
jgi:hypothetical protein